MILKDDKDCMKALQNAAKAAQRRILTLDQEDDHSQTLKAVNDLLDAMVRDLESLAFLRFLQEQTLVDDDGETFSVNLATRCHSAFVLDRLGELNTSDDE